MWKIISTLLGRHCSRNVIICDVSSSGYSFVFPYRGSEGSGGDSHSASKQSYPAGEFPEAHRAAERPDRHRELDGTRQGGCSGTERSAGNKCIQSNKVLSVFFFFFLRSSFERGACTSSPKRGYSRGCFSWLVKTKSTST